MKISMKSQTVLKRGQKRPNRLFKGQKKAKLCLWYCYSCHKEASKLHEYHYKFPSKLRLSLPWLCTGAHTDASLTFHGLWDCTLWVHCRHSLHTDPSPAFCTHAKVISHSLLSLRTESQAPFHFLDVIFAFLSRRRRPVCKCWACLVRTYKTLHGAHISSDYAKKIFQI